MGKTKGRCGDRRGRGRNKGLDGDRGPKDEMEIEEGGRTKGRDGDRGGRGGPKVEMQIEEEWGGPKDEMEIEEEGRTNRRDGDTGGRIK